MIVCVSRAPRRPNWSPILSSPRPADDGGHGELLLVARQEHVHHHVRPERERRARSSTNIPPTETSRARPSVAFDFVGPLAPDLDLWRRPATDGIVVVRPWSVGLSIRGHAGVASDADPHGTIVRLSVESALRSRHGWGRLEGPPKAKVVRLAQGSLASGAAPRKAAPSFAAQALGLVPLVVGLVFGAIVLPRSVAPEEIPLPRIDGRALAAVVTERRRPGGRG